MHGAAGGGFFPLAAARVKPHELAASQSNLAVDHGARSRDEDVVEPVMVCDAPCHNGAPRRMEGRERRDADRLDNPKAGE